MILKVADYLSTVTFTDIIVSIIKGLDVDSAVKIVFSGFEAY